MAIFLRALHWRLAVSKSRFDVQRNPLFGRRRSPPAEMLIVSNSVGGIWRTFTPLGATALRAACPEADYDAVVLDLMFSDMDGLDVVRDRGLARPDDTPVLMLTARCAAIDRIDRALTRPVPTTISKPFWSQP